MFATIIECILDAMNLVVGSFRGAAARLFISKHKWEITIPPSCILDHTTPPRIAYLSYIRYHLSSLLSPLSALSYITNLSSPLSQLASPISPTSTPLSSLTSHQTSHLPSHPPPRHPLSAIHTALFAIVRTYPTEARQHK